MSALRRPGTCGDMRGHAGTCGDMRGHAGTCGDMRGHAGTCGDMRGHAGNKRSMAAKVCRMIRSAANKRFTAAYAAETEPFRGDGGK